VTRNEGAGFARAIQWEKRGRQSFRSAMPGGKTEIKSRGLRKGDKGSSGSLHQDPGKGGN